MAQTRWSLGHTITTSMSGLCLRPPVAVLAFRSHILSASAASISLYRALSFGCLSASGTANSDSAACCCGPRVNPSQSQCFGQVPPDVTSRGLNGVHKRCVFYVFRPQRPLWHHHHPYLDLNESRNNMAPLDSIANAKSSAEPTKQANKIQGPQDADTRENTPICNPNDIPPDTASDTESDSSFRPQEAGDETGAARREYSRRDSEKYAMVSRSSRKAKFLTPLRRRTLLPSTTIHGVDLRRGSGGRRHISLPKCEVTRVAQRTTIRVV